MLWEKHNLTVYAAKEINELWTRDGIAGSRYAVSDKGWIDQELFFFWFKEHLLTHNINCHPLFLLLDGHSSHYEPVTINFVIDNNIAVFCLPPHTAHECQPLDQFMTHQPISLHDFPSACSLYTCSLDVRVCIIKCVLSVVEIQRVKPTVTMMDCRCHVMCVNVTFYGLNS